MMAKQMQYHHFYMNAQNKQALGVVCKEDTATWGMCLVVETATPFSLGMLMAINAEQDMTGWHEITKDEFKKLQKQYGQDFIAAASAPRKQGRLQTFLSKFKRSAHGRKVPFSPKVLEGGRK